MKVKFHPEAEADASEAQRWYAQRSNIAARAFLTELKLAIDNVTKSPEIYPLYLSGSRRYFFPSFPFSLVYRKSNEVITVLARPS